MNVKFLNNKNAYPLVKGSVDAAGWDIKTNEPYILAPGERHAFSTGIHTSIEPGYYAEIWPRSGLSVKNGIDRLAGVIDSDYRGEWKVVLVNHGDSSIGFKPGDKIAQVIFKEVIDVNFQKVNNLDDSMRGNGGFGSTGMS